MKRALAVAWCLTVGGASAATLQGRVSSMDAGIDGLEVRLWARIPKGFAYGPPAGRVTTSADGGRFAFDVPAGEYTLDARMPSGLSGNWGDRWYDVAPPLGNGYVPAEADVFTLDGGEALTGLELELEVNGGFDGVADGGSSALGGLQARAEFMADRRIHHNDVTKTGAVRTGEFSFRGLVPGATRLLLHDPNYRFADVVVPGVTVVANAAPVLPQDVRVDAAPADSLEPNSGPFTPGATVDAALVNASDAGLFLRGHIGPRSAGDTDWFCFDAQVGARYRLAARGTLTLEDGGLVDSPWVDPVLGWWAAAPDVDAGWPDGGRFVVDGGVLPDGGLAPLLLAEDDDSAGGLSSALTTPTVTVPGRYCASVTTFGDGTWTGLNQGSAGPYVVSLQRANEPPVITASIGGQPAPVPPAAHTLAEAQAVTVTFTYADPDGTLQSGDFELADADGGVLLAGSLNPTAGTQVVSWTASQVAARASPYTLRATVSDGDLSSTAAVVLVVTGVNQPPTTPVLLTPDSGVSVPTRRPNLTCLEGSDDDRELLTYEFEFTYGTSTTPALSVFVPGVAGGWIEDGGLPRPRVTYPSHALDENTRVRWRVRAYDGTAANGHSPWTDTWWFLVDSINDPPAAPTLVKPAAMDVLMTTTATLSATLGADPEGEPQQLRFEVGTDVAFSSLAVQSPWVSAAATGETQWVATTPLAWGGSYYARVWAKDARDAGSPVSAVHAFSVRPNGAPTTPTLGPPFAACAATGEVFTRAPTELRVGFVNDVEQDPVSLEVQVFRFADNPTTAMPVFSSTTQQVGMSVTTISLAGLTLEEDQTYRVRVRATDGRTPTAWVECLFTLDALPNGTGSDGGAGGSGGAGGGGTAPMGCGCGAVEGGALWLLVAGWAARRRRARQRAPSSPAAR